MYRLSSVSNLHRGRVTRGTVDSTGDVPWRILGTERKRQREALESQSSSRGPDRVYSVVRVRLTDVEVGSRLPQVKHYNRTFTRPSGDPMKVSVNHGDSNYRLINPFPFTGVWLVNDSDHEILVIKSNKSPRFQKEYLFPGKVGRGSCVTSGSV